VYPGGDAGFLFRAESFSSFGTGTTPLPETAGVIHWTPGYVNASNSHLLNIGVATATTSGAAGASGAQSPGTAFLANTARGVRCVAACLKVTFPGAESARSGRIHYGITPAGMLDAGESASPDQIAQTLQNYSRTPSDTIELFWKPGAADFEFNDPSATAVATLRDRKQSLTVVFAGLPGSVGITCHFTAIYEW
jgi:hypothetical protein